MNDFFKILNYITFEKKPYDELTENEKRSINIYMLHRYLSMVPNYISIVNEVQRLNLSPQHTYIVYLDKIPVKKQWIKYIKKENNKDGDLESLAFLFKLSTREIKEYTQYFNFDLYLKQYGKNDPKDNKTNKKSRKKKDKLGV